MSTPISMNPSSSLARSPRDDAGAVRPLSHRVAEALERPAAPKVAVKKTKDDVVGADAAGALVPFRPEALVTWGLSTAGSLAPAAQRQVPGIPAGTIAPEAAAGVEVSSPAATAKHERGATMLTANSEANGATSKPNTDPVALTRPDTRPDMAATPQPNTDPVALTRPDTRPDMAATPQHAGVISSDAAVVGSAPLREKHVGLEDLTSTLPAGPQTPGSSAPVTQHVLLAPEARPVQLPAGWVPSPVPTAALDAPAPTTVRFDSWGKGHGVNIVFASQSVVLTPSSERVGHAIAQAMQHVGSDHGLPPMRVTATDADGRHSHGRGRHDDADDT